MSALDQITAAVKDAEYRLDSFGKIVASFKDTVTRLEKQIEDLKTKRQEVDPSLLSLAEELRVHVSSFDASLVAPDAPDAPDAPAATVV